MDTSERDNATAEGYDRWAASYDDRDPSTWLDEPFLLQHLRPFCGCRILDLGCGTGRYLRLLPESAYRIVGVDLSRNMLARARARISARTDVRLVQASVTSLPFAPATFDRVMSGLIIDHVPSAPQCFQAITAVLAPRGIAVIAAVHPDMQRLTGCDIEVSGHEHEATRIRGYLHEVQDLLTAAREARLSLVAKEEPAVTPAMLEHRPHWKTKLGCPALLLLTLRKEPDT